MIHFFKQFFSIHVIITAVAICIIFFFFPNKTTEDVIEPMTLPFWGQLQKNQDDPQTIEEAIQQYVEQHNEDPESHLGEGQSLHEHTHESVIDHPPGSIVPDKFSRTDIFLWQSFPSLDSLSVDGNFSVSNFRLVGEPDWEVPTFATARFFVPRPSYPSPGNDLLLYSWSFRSFWSVESYGSGNFVQFGLFNTFNSNNTTKVLDGIYFSVEDQNLYARIKLGALDEAIFIMGYPEYQDGRQFECMYTVEDKMLRFFVAGNEVASFDLTPYAATLTLGYLTWRGYGPSEEDQVIFTADNFMWAIEPNL